MSDVTLETIDGRPTLRFTRQVTAPLAEVWRAVSEPGVTSEWFVPGPPFTQVRELEELLGQVQGTASKEPRSRVTWAIGDDEFTFRLDETPAGVDVELLVALDDRDQAAIGAMTFDSFLDRLAPFLAGEKLTYGAFADLDEQARRLDADAIRFGIDPEPGREWVKNTRAALAAGDEVESDYTPDPDAAEQMEAAMLPYLREHEAELAAAEARRGEEESPWALIEEWFPSARDTPEFVERMIFVMGRYIGDESLSVYDVDAAWRTTHPDV